VKPATPLRPITVIAVTTGADHLAAQALFATMARNGSPRPSGSDPGILVVARVDGVAVAAAEVGFDRGRARISRYAGTVGYPEIRARLAILEHAPAAVVRGRSRAA
jgi:hypothetical protein